MAQQLLDFSDLIAYCREELGLQSSDTTSINKLKRIMNAVYLNEVVPFKRWRWLQGRTKVVHKAVYATGTASVNASSTTVTLSAASPSSYGSFAGWNFAVDGFAEIYEISTHTSATTGIVLTSNYQGTTDTAVSFKIWRDVIDLPTDARETTELWHGRHRKVMTAMGWQEIQEQIVKSPKAQGFPSCYSTLDYYDPSSGTGETESDRYRQVRIYPSITDQNVTINVNYTKEISPMNSDADEPALPLEDRIVLCYGTLAQAWRSLKRNDQDASINQGLYDRKLKNMSGHIEDSFDVPKLRPNLGYVRASRNRLGNTFLLPDFGGGDSSYTTNSIEKTEFRTLTAGEISAAQLTLASTPLDAGNVLVDVIQGGPQQYTVDYTISGQTLSWSGLGLAGVLVAGDKLRIHYWV